MYSLDWYCNSCNGCYKTADRHTVCPVDKTILQLQFKTVKYGQNR
jgi:hypothetical protein